MAKHKIINLIKELRMSILGSLVGVESIARLKRKGLIVGENLDIEPGVIIDSSHCWLIKIGDNVTLSPRVHILAHDASTKRFLGYTKIGKVEIGDNSFIGADSIILPNVKIGKNVIIGCSSVVTKDIPDELIAVGNPARVVCSLKDYLQRHRDNMKVNPVYDEKWTVRGKITKEMKDKMIAELSWKIGYVE
ncbi:MAG: acyltransferase [Candidatus Omnitrophica bacterium]|nr:acyltransferase [Candidatus Omnitrophota bacterium]